MSYYIKTEKLTETQLKKIQKDLKIVPKFNPFTDQIGNGEDRKKKTVLAFEYVKDRIILPLNYFYTNFNDLYVKKEYPSTNYECKISLRDYQLPVYNECVELLKKNKTCFLNLYTSFGKTVLMIYLAYKCKLKTLILSNISAVKEKTIETIEKYTTAKIQRIDSKTEFLDDECDFYICGFRIAKEKPIGFYKNVGLMVTDESDTLCTKEYMKSLQRVFPKYSLGLSATIKRTDGMEKVIYSFYGENSMIVRSNQKEKIIYLYQTDIELEYELNPNGTPKWGTVLKDQMYGHPERNEFICEIVEEYPARIIMILTKEQDHCRLLEEMLNKRGVNCTSFFSTDKKYDGEARVLISTYSKGGRGFDDTRLNMLILAADTLQIEQKIGRVGRNIEDKNIPIIVDIVDDMGSMIKHWNERKKYYKTSNSKIYHYSDRNNPSAKELVGNMRKSQKGVNFYLENRKKRLI